MRVVAAAMCLPMAPVSVLAPTLSFATDNPAGLYDPLGGGLASIWSRMSSGCAGPSAQTGSLPGARAFRILKSRTFVQERAVPIMEFMATINSSDSEAQVRGRVVRFLTSRRYRTTADPAEFKRGSLFGSLTGFTPKKWAVTVRFKTVEPGVFFYRFEIDTTGQSVTSGERAFWDREKKSLEDTIEGRVSNTMDASDREVASQGMQIVKTIFIYSVGGAFIVGAATIALHFVGIEIFSGVAAIGAAVGFQRALSTA